MKNKIQFFLLGILMLCVLIAYIGCNKDERTVTGPGTGGNVTTYTVNVIVLGPSGAPQGGATVALQNPPFVSSIFTAISDSAGRATIQCPAGYQTIIVTMGTVFTATVTVTVQATSVPQTTSPVTLQQNTTPTGGKILVLTAGCETIENVLTNSNIAFTTFDRNTLSYMRSQVDIDSVALLTYLRQYAIVFSDCNCGDEYGYPKLARLYGRYVQQGGKIYGGHYNYMNLQYIFSPNYRTSAASSGTDSLRIINTDLQVALGYNLIKWPGYTFSSYGVWSDVPVGTTTIYAVKSSSPGSTSSPQGIPIIVENRLGSGKFVWTAYHNDDILSDARLIRIVRYFLYNM